MSEKLLPCPFCGPGQSMVDPWFDDVSKRWTVGCGRCGASSGRSVHAEGSKEAAIKAWNTRAPRCASVGNAIDRDELIAMLTDLASVNMQKDAAERQARRMADALIEKLRMAAAPVENIADPFGYVLPKSGVDNGYYFVTPEEFERVEERFRSLYTPLYKQSSPAEHEDHPCQATPDMFALQEQRDGR